jgi:hypothetical protein
VETEVVSLLSLGLPHTLYTILHARFSPTDGHLVTLAWTNRDDRPWSVLRQTGILQGK